MTDHAPQRAGRPRSQSAPRRLLWDWNVVVAGGIVVALASCGGAARPPADGLDPFSNTSVTYTPAQGPPSPTLLDSRPDYIVERYLADYIRLAGTYPCVQDLSQYAKSDDPVLRGQPCPVTRAVATYVVTSVTIQTHGLANLPVATVTVVLTYRDGQQWTTAVFLSPDRYQQDVFTYRHLDCWSSADTLELFGRLVSDIPNGAAFSSPDGVTIQCRDYAGHILTT